MTDDRNSEQLHVEITGEIARVMLNRPEKMNALTWTMIDELPQVADDLNGRSRAVILFGTGGNFSAGLDVENFAGDIGKPEVFRSQALDLPAGETSNRFQKPLTAWRAVHQPVIAAIEGACLGGGCQIALGADIRIAHPAAKLGLIETRWGLIPDMGLMTVLPRLMPIDRAKRLIMTGEIVTGQAAFELGLVTSLSEDPLSAAEQLAADIAKRSPESVAATKQLLDEGWNLDEAPALRLEAERQAELMGSPNQREAVRANLQRRAPRFG